MLPDQVPVDLPVRFQWTLPSQVQVNVVIQVPVDVAI